MSEADQEPGVSEVEGLRARRRRLVCDDVARIAVRLFLDRGYDGVSVEEIAAAAGMSERTFFRYFATKDEVLRRYRGSLVVALVRAFEEQPADEPPVRALRGAYLATSHVPAADRARVHAIGGLLMAVPDVRAKAMADSVFDEAVVAELARRMGAGAADLRPAAVAAAVSAAAAAGWDHWVRSAGTGDPAETVVGAIDLLGLNTGEGDAEGRVNR